MNPACQDLPLEVRNWIGRQLFDHVPNNIVVIDRQFRIVVANHNFEEVFGEPRGRFCYQAYKKRNSPCENCMAARTFEDGKVRINDEVGTDRHGRPAHYVVHIAPVYDEVGQVSYVIEMSYDVTETKSLQKEYNILFERVPCYVAVINRDLRIVRANELLRQTFGERTGEHCYEVYKHRSERCPDCPALKTFADGRSYQAEHVGVDKNGKQTFYVVSTAPLGRSSGQFSHVIEMSSDVTELKKLEQERLVNERLVAVGQTVAQLAHAIKNILTGLQGGIFVVKAGMKSGSEQRISEGWEMLERNVGRISELARGLLDLSRGDTLEVQLQDPLQLAREAFDLFEPAAREQGIQLALDIPESMPPAPFDGEGIHACLANLLSNALDACLASEPGGCRVTLKVREVDGVIIFEVRDTGCGMDYQIKKKVFTTFFSTKGAQGTGLGLMTTRRIVQAHGGKISIESTPGQGSCFCLEFPRQRLPRPGADEGRREPAAAASPAGSSPAGGQQVSE